MNFLRFASSVLHPLQSYVRTPNRFQRRLSSLLLFYLILQRLLNFTLLAWYYIRTGMCAQHPCNWFRLIFRMRTTGRVQGSTHTWGEGGGEEMGRGETAKKRIFTTASGRNPIFFFSNYIRIIIYPRRGFDSLETGCRTTLDDIGITLVRIILYIVRS